MRQLKLRFRFVVFWLMLTTCAVSAWGQNVGATQDWETLRPEGEEFTVLMPKGSTFESSKEPYHKMELNTRTYLSKGQPGPVFAIVSMSGIKSNPALYTEQQRVNSYVDAFKTLFAPKIRKDVVAKLVFVKDKTLQGNLGREYRLTIGDLNGTANVFATRKRFYSIVYLNTKKDDAIAEEFLSSFVLPDKSAEPTVSTTAQNSPTPQEIKTTNAEEAPPADHTNVNADPKAESANPAKRGPISAGVLNGKAISLPKPDYPADARSAGVDGVVVIQVTVDEQGNVTEARAVSGPKILQEPSVNAAFQAKFSPTLVEGAAVKVTGVIVYNFGRPMS